MSHAHSHDHDHHHDKEVALLDPADCAQFMESAHSHEHDHDHEHGHHHDHDHDHTGGGKVTWRLITMLVLTGVFFLAELITGFVTKSLAMQGDAFHMFSDEASLVIGLVAHRLSKKPPTNKMTFGWARTEVIGGLVNATFLLAICLTLLFESIERFITPEEIQEPDAFLIVGILGFLVNLVGIFIFHDHSHSENLQGIFLHIVGDLLGSIAVIISAAVVKWTTWEGKKYLDPAISLFIVILLVYGSQNLFRRTARTVCECVPYDVSIPAIHESLMRIEGMVAIHELHVWELSKKCYIALLHIVVDKKENNKRVQELTHNVLMQHKIFSSTVQIEFVDDFPSGVDNHDSCFYASTFGSEKRCFTTKPVYQHSIGCPHINVPGAEHDHDHDHHHHDHDHHDHDHGHDHDHDHHHDSSSDDSHDEDHHDDHEPVQV